MKKYAIAFYICAGIFCAFLMINSCSKLQDNQLSTLLNRFKPNVPDCPPGYHWDFDYHTCVPDDPGCAAGDHWDPNFGGCVPNCPVGYHNAPPNGACVVDDPDPISVDTNPNNPYDSTGLLHNDALDAIMPYYNDGSTEPTQQNVFDNTKNYLVSIGYDPAFIDSSYNYTVEQGLYSFPSMLSIDSVGVLLYNNGNISSLAKSFIDTLSDIINALDTGETPSLFMYDGFAGQAITYENQIINNGTLADTEKAMLLSAYSIARYSCAYWMNYYNGSSDQLILNRTNLNKTGMAQQTITKRHWFHWKHVLGSDVAGAIGGAVGGAVLAVSFGEPEAALTLAKKGAVDVGVTCSVGDAALQVWNHFVGNN